MAEVMIPLPDDVLPQVQARAAEAGQSAPQYLADLVLEALADMEEAAEVERRIADLDAGRTQPVPLDDVLKRYGMAD
jgi:RHH-type rel operon transcriptional repressor/antitoxin RelB